MDGDVNIPVVLVYDDPVDRCPLQLAVHRDGGAVDAPRLRGDGKVGGRTEGVASELYGAVLADAVAKRRLRLLVAP
jgi:hypothetical protein